jgi:hypothetical protein
MTGSTEGRSYQLAGTAPEASCPGLAYLGASRNTVASTVLAGTVLAGTVLVDMGLAGTVLVDMGLVDMGLVDTGLAGVLLAGGSCRSLAACLAFGACDGRATAAVVPPADGLLPDESSRPADTAATAAVTTLTVIAARFFLFGAAPAGRRDTADLRFASSQLHMVTKSQVSSRRGRWPVIAGNSACQDRR